MLLKLHKVSWRRHEMRVQTQICHSWITGTLQLRECVSNLTEIPRDGLKPLWTRRSTLDHARSAQRMTGPTEGTEGISGSPSSHSSEPHLLSLQVNKTNLSLRLTFRAVLYLFLPILRFRVVPLSSSPAAAVTTTRSGRVVRKPLRCDS